MMETKFLGLIINDTLSWKQHIDQVINKVSTACYALRYITYIVSSDMLKLIYFAHVHSIISYGIIFGVAPLVLTKFLYYKRKLLEL
jgi:hypothetical protein